MQGLRSLVYGDSTCDQILVNMILIGIPQYEVWHLHFYVKYIHNFLHCVVSNGLLHLIEWIVWIHRQMNDWLIVTIIFFVFIGKNTSHYAAHGRTLPIWTYIATLGIFVWKDALFYFTAEFVSYRLICFNASMKLVFNDVMVFYCGYVCLCVCVLLFGAIGMIVTNHFEDRRFIFVEMGWHATYWILNSWRGILFRNAIPKSFVPYLGNSLSVKRTFNAIPIWCSFYTFCTLIAGGGHYSVLFSCDESLLQACPPKELSLYSQPTHLQAEQHAQDKKQNPPSPMADQMFEHEEMLCKSSQQESREHNDSSSTIHVSRKFTCFSLLNLSFSSMNMYSEAGRGHSTR